MDKVQDTPTRTDLSKPILPDLLKWINESNFTFKEEEIEILSSSLKKRSDFGLQKYGTFLCTHNGRNSELDLQQELIDGLQYLFQMNMEGKKLNDKTITIFKANFFLMELMINQ